MNSDDIEVRGAVLDDVVARVAAAYRATPRQIEPGVWRIFSAPDYRMSLDIYVDDTEPGPPVIVELRGCWVDLDDARNRDITLWVLGHAYDTLATDTDWWLRWTSDDQDGDGIFKQRTDRLPEDHA